MVEYLRHQRPRLASYLDSDLQRLPADWVDYTHKGSKSQQCLFCANNHDYNEVLVTSPNLLSVNGQMSGTFSCESCFHYIKEKEAELYQSRGIKSSTYNSKLVEERITLLVDSYSFAQDVNMYMREYADNHMDLYTKHWNCYLCNGPATDYFRYIDVPVNNGAYLSGGSVRCCESCWDILKEVAAEFTLVRLRENHKIHEEFCHCGDAYYITEHEMADRQIGQTFDRHLCPKCTVMQLQSDNEVLSLFMGRHSSLVENTEIGKYSSWKINRFIQIDCGYCRTGEIDVDLTLPYSLTKKMHMSAYGNKTMCSDCSQGTTGPAIVLPFNIDKRSFYWQLYPLGPNKYRKIIRSASGQVYRDEVVDGWLSDLVALAREDFDPLPPKTIIMM